MKVAFVHYIICILIVFVLPAHITAEITEICNGASTTVMDGEYRVSNNVWGASTAQCLEVDLDGTYFKVSLSEHNNPGGDVAAYPFIYKGCHWGGCTPKDNPFPMEVNELESAPFTWKIGTDGVGGTWNAAFEAWFSVNGATSPDGGELMIWLDYYGGAGPAGSFVENVDIGGYSWNLRFAAFTSWNYIAYQITTPVDSITLDLKDFIQDACTRGYLYTTWYLDNMEAGFEIWRDGQGLTSHYYSASAIGGAEPVNYAPVPFNLTYPYNSKTVDSLVISFRWQESVDPNLDPVEYILHISGTDADTTVTGIDENNYEFDGKAFLQYSSTYTWYVEATDGIETTESSQHRTFKTPEPSGVNSIHQVPTQFKLDQNYPNPFNAQTEIGFEMDRDTHIDLSMYNLMGTKLQVLKHGSHKAGQYRIIFDASDLPSGIYYYKLESPFQTQIRKCIYIK